MRLENNGGASTDSVALLSQCFHALGDNIERVVKGKRETVELALVCLFSEGHLLIEDVPGTGKTTLARCLAASLEASWHRVQFTPDLLPSDITGVTIYRQNTGTFEFLPGPVFANIVLGDEVNRASPKTQSSMLEVMEERQVTADGTTHPVPRPFMVIATQNSVDMGGTYPLPEAQLDRFLMRVTIGYPDHASEVAVLSGAASETSIGQLPTIATGRHISEFIQVARQIQVAPQLYDYLVRVVAATRELPEVRLGASPRGSVALLRAVRVRAASQGRAYALPEDVKALAGPVLAHRLILTPEAELSGSSGADVIAEALATVPVPQAGAQL
ncbi:MULTISPECIES: MoxR family ATPase [unclassified Streptomyces]|uniref:AAA family ATPase n=1 Tax=unclassified Streptomyces TaxID=2593676 RepID=UPI002DDABCD5|nr:MULTISPECIES: MoxR family ATPase [unclassified Streptomyces]WSA95980.1 MoxR family ATPase [Streptomyces sp. NBC_01795]WSB80396.1 MoxR family ATPase [Streptomyces sp. NBC_01775]WSS11399.1 MoxR family ATPase [Streptomyces sp. NBC_01186]WSS40105.1 MoxR family ATPase [Streptomyces sp. NBC_01187]